MTTPENPPQTEGKPARPPKPQTVLQVVRRERISPSLVRLTLGGEGFEKFQDNGFTDRYVKLVFAKPELNLTAPFNMAELKKTLPKEDVPVTRTYTVRRVDEENKQLQIDFVVHGDEGLAGPWAARAEEGEGVLMLGPGGKYSTDPEAPWHLLAGDASALPAISSALEAMPRDARGLAFLVVDDAADRLDIDAPEGVELVWDARPGTGADPNRLAELMRTREWPEETPQVFAHGERESIKQVRRLLKEREIPKDRISISGYWAYGRTEDRFQAEKREPIGKIED